MKIQNDRFNELTKKEKIMVGVAGGCLLLYVYLALIINPIMNSIDPLKEEIDDLQYKVSDLGNINIKIEQLKETYESKKKSYEKAAAVLPKSDRYPQLMRDINKNIADNSLKLVSISNSEGTSSKGSAENNENQEGNTLAEGLNSNTVSVTVEGDYNNILTFIDKIENGNRIGVISSCTISSDSAKTVGNIVISYLYGTGGEEEKYNFNNGTYGTAPVF